jgi:hypothetical protein
VLTLPFLSQFQIRALESQKRQQEIVLRRKTQEVSLQEARVEAPFPACCSLGRKKGTRPTWNPNSPFAFIYLVFLRQGFLCTPGWSPPASAAQVLGL